MVVPMSKKPLLIAAISFVSLVILITARAAYVYVKEQSEAHQREEQFAKAQQAAQDAMKQWQQQMGAYSQMQQNVPNLANLPNMANMPNFSSMPGVYSPASQVAMARLMQSGVGMGVASYLVQAKAQVLSQSNNSVRYSLTFPNGVYSESTVTITPNQHYSPSSAELAIAQKTGRHVFDVHLSSERERYEGPHHAHLLRPQLGHSRKLAATPAEQVRATLFDPSLRFRRRRRTRCRHRPRYRHRNRERDPQREG